MPNYKLYKGQNPDFLGEDQKVNLPVLENKQIADLAEDNSKNTILSYINYSVLLSSSRKFPYFTASNIDGPLFKKISRDDVFDGKGEKWTKDSRISEDNQWGNELYNAKKSDFDK